MKKRMVYVVTFAEECTDASFCEGSPNAAFWSKSAADVFAKSGWDGSVHEVEIEDDHIEASKPEAAFEQMLEALRGLMRLRNETEMTYEEAYYAMFKGLCEDWRNAEAAIAAAEGSAK